MKVLLLAGTAEARRIAGFLASSDVEAIASFAGVTRARKPLPIPVRTGGFGGCGAQTDFMRRGAFDAVIDATHPFATRISARSQAISNQLGMPYLRVLRPAWVPEAGDNWHVISKPDEAPAIVPQGANVFLATGALSIEGWASLSVGRTIYCRRAEAGLHRFPFQGGWITGSLAQSAEDERHLFEELGIEFLVTKNAGGVARAKLDAARELGVPVIMLRRPAPPDCDVVASPEEAMLWLAKL